MTLLEQLAGKPGFATTEFNFCLLCFVVINLMALKGIIHGSALAIIDPLLPFAYQWLRQSASDPKQERALELAKAAIAASSLAAAPQVAASQSFTVKPL